MTLQPTCEVYVPLSETPACPLQHTLVQMVHAKNNQSSTLPSSNTSKATEDAVLVNTTAIEVESENDIVEEMPASKLKNSEASADKLDVAEPEAATSSHVDHSPAKSAKSWSVLDPWKVRYSTRGSFQIGFCTHHLILWGKRTLRFTEFRKLRLCFSCNPFQH